MVSDGDDDDDDGDDWQGCTAAWGRVSHDPRRAAQLLRSARRRLAPLPWQHRHAASALASLSTYLRIRSGQADQQQRVLVETHRSVNDCLLQCSHVKTRPHMTYNVLVGR